MQPTKLTINCPSCGNPISINEALAKDLKSDLENEYKHKYTEALNKIELQNKEREEELKKKISEDLEKELTFLKEQNAEKNRKLEEAQQFELEIRKEKVKLEEEKKNFELVKQRELDKERDKIREETSKNVSEEYRLKMAEQDKKLEDVLKANEELNRKLQQGSQQMQGEVMELELEEMLKNEFPFDEILPVQKGINGADIIQTVRDNFGRICGIIVWESKRTKAWSEGWIQKLKDDQRKAKADTAVIVSTVLPKEITSFKFRDGIYVSNFECLIDLATVLRLQIISIAQTKQSSVGKNEKMEVLYNYLTGIEFRQRVEAIVDTFSGLKQDLEKEKMAYQKIWAKREKQIQRVIENTLGMHGDLHGLIGGSMPEIKGIDLNPNEDF